MEKTAISLFMDGKSSELEKFLKGVNTDDVNTCCYFDFYNIIILLLICSKSYICVCACV